MKEFLGALGSKLGVSLCGVGLLLVFLGWNGAASVDRVPSQFPYLISGGVAGLCLVVMGVGMIVVQNQRADRAELQATLRELRDALGASADAGLDDDFALPERRPTPAEYARALEPTAPATDPDDTSVAPAPQSAGAVRRGRSRRAPLSVDDA